MFSGLLIFEGFVSKPFRRVVFREGGRNTAPPPRPSGCTAVSVFLVGPSSRSCVAYSWLNVAKWVSSMMPRTREQLKRIKYLLQKQNGNVVIDHFTFLQALQYIAENGCKWRALPKEKYYI